MNFSLKNDEPEENKKFSFKFGDRMSEAAAVTGRAENDDTSSTMFADVDLKALEKEILGGGAPEIDRIEERELGKPAAKAKLTAVADPESAESLAADTVTETAVSGDVEAPKASVNVQGAVPPAADADIEVTGEAAELQALQAKAQRELQSAEKALKNRMAKYANMVADVKVAPKSTVTRVEARRRQKELAAEWDKENLSDIDDLRREFTKALFKK